MNKLIPLRSFKIETYFPKLLKACLIFSLLPAYSTISQAQDTAGEDSSAMLEEVVTIGTRVKGRTVTDSVVAVDVISGDALIRIGHSELARMIQNIAPSFNFNSNTISDGSDIARPATLRGLSPDQVLVLVNGKRHIGQAWMNIGSSVGSGATGVDLNSIPPSAIERIEVLRDGASSQYGSDAMAGVINIILKEGTNATTVSAFWGETFDGDGGNNVVSFNSGWDIGQGDGFINITGEYRDRDHTNRAGPSNREFAGVNAGIAANPTAGDTIFRIGDSDSENWQFMANAMLPVGESGEVYAFGKFSDRDGESTGFYRFPFQTDRANPFLYPDGFLPHQTTGVEDEAATAGFRFDFSDTWSGDISLNWGRNQFSFGDRNSMNASIGAQFVEDQYAARNPDGSVMLDANGLAVLTSRPTTADLLAMADDIRANSGPTEGFAGAAELEQLIVNFDVTGEFEVGLSSPLYAAMGFEYRDEDYTITAGSPASYICGDGTRTNIRSLNAITSGDDGANCGFQAFPGYSPQSAGSIGRDNIALYVDVEANVTDRLLLAGAVRYEDYSDVGSETTGKIAVRYEVTDGFALRASFSTGFRAASLPQQGFTSIVTQAGGGGELTQTLIAPLDDDFTRGFGINELEFETSDNFSAGFVWTAIPNLTVTLDGFFIGIDDRLALGSPFGVATLISLGLTDAASSLIARNIGQGRTFFNALDTETTGVEFVINHTAEIFGGDLNTTIAGSIIDTSIEKVKLPTGVVDESSFVNSELRTLIEEGQPSERVSFTLDWVRNKLGLLARLNYYGSTKSEFIAGASLPPFFQDFSLFPPGAPPGTFQPFVTTPDGFTGVDASEMFHDIGDAFILDLELSYNVTDNLQIAVGGNNIFDTLPDPISGNAGVRYITDGVVVVEPLAGGPPRLNASFGNAIYPFRGVAFGLNGGYYYLRANYRFDHL